MADAHNNETEIARMALDIGANSTVLSATRALVGELERGLIANDRPDYISPPGTVPEGDDLDKLSWHQHITQLFLRNDTFCPFVRAAGGRLVVAAQQKHRSGCWPRTE